MLARQLPVPRQLGAGSKLASDAAITKLSDDLLANRLRITGRQMKQQRKCITVHIRYIQYVPPSRLSRVNLDAELVPPIASPRRAAPIQAARLSVDDQKHRVAAPCLMSACIAGDPVMITPSFQIETRHRRSTPCTHPGGSLLWSPTSRAALLA